MIVKRNLKDTLGGSGKVSRRRFLAGSLGVMCGPQIVSAAVLGRGGATAPSDRIGLGFIGAGSRGTDHIRTLLGYPGVEIVAVCDPYLSKCQQASKMVRDRSAEQGIARDGCGTFQDYRLLLAQNGIDAVFIASPENWHALHGIAALEAGKDVYGEKALARTAAESRALTDTVRRTGRVFQVGMQQRSARDFRFAAELARNGYLGRLHTVRVAVPGGRALPDAPPTPPPPDLDYEIWLGPAPYTPHNDLKCSFNWYFMADYCAGWIQSWGVHHIDMAQWGVPEFASGQIKVKGTADFPSAGLADTSVTWRVEYRTANGLLLVFTDDGQHQIGCRFEGEAGWVHADRSGIWADPASLLTTIIKPGEERLYVSDDHHANFLQCVRTRKEPASPVEAGHTANLLTLIGDIATRLGRELTWDWTTERFIDCDEANRLLSRPMRAPWTL